MLGALKDISRRLSSVEEGKEGVKSAGQMLGQRSYSRILFVRRSKIHRPMGISVIGLALIVVTSQAVAGGLPSPTRTVYKCEDGKKIYYSDSPCVGATKVDVTPTRGLNKSTGKEAVGADVRREQTREQIAEAVRPLTGMSSQQFDRSGRRMKLSADAQQECRRLDRTLPLAEQAERAAQGSPALKSAQVRLFNLRKRFRDIRCE